MEDRAKWMGDRDFGINWPDNHSTDPKSLTVDHQAGQAREAAEKRMAATNPPRSAGPAGLFDFTPRLRPVTLADGSIKGAPPCWAELHPRDFLAVHSKERVIRVI